MASRFLLSRSISLSLKQGSLSLSSTSSSFLRLRPVSAFAAHLRRISTAAPPASARSFSTRQTSSSLSDPSPNWSNRPPKETILLDGCDFEHWLVVMETPKGENITRDEIIASYIKTLAQVVGSEEEARMKIYSVSTKHYFAFGALVSEELSFKLKELENVRWVLPDSYLDVRNKDYGGEPFINGEAVPYDPKYHAEWVRNNARANERNRRNDRPRNFDRSRNHDRRDNMQNQSRGPPPNMGPANPPNNMGPANPPNNMGPPPPNNMGRSPPNMGPRAPNMGPSNMGPNMGPNNMGPNMGPNNMGPNNMGPNNMGPNNMGPNNMGPNNMGPNNMRPNMGPNNMGPNNMGQVPQNMGYAPNNMGGVPSNGQNNQYRGGPNGGGPQFQNPQYQNNDMRGPPQQSNEYLRNYEPNAPAGNNAYPPQNFQGRDMPPNYQ